MPDEKPVDGQEDAPPAVDAQGGGDEPVTDGAGTAPPGGQTYTREQLERAAKDSSRKERERAAALEAELKTYREAEEARKQAEMSEGERKQAELEGERSARARAEAEAAQAKHEALFERTVARHAQGIPAAYLSLVTGTSEEEIVASIGEARTAFEADRKGVAGSILSELATLTPEDLAEKYPEAKALAERLKGQPISIGAPTNAGRQTPPKGGADIDISKLPPSQRENALVEKLSRSR